MKYKNGGFMAVMWSWNKRRHIVAGFKDNASEDIFHASAVGDDEKVGILLDNDAGINERDENGWTPLMYSSFNHQLGVMKLLINAKADLNLKNNRGETALILAVKTRHKYFSPWAKNDQIDTVKLLVESDADIFVKDFEGRQALNWARQNKLFKIINILKERKPAPDNNETPC